MRWASWKRFRPVASSSRYRCNGRNSALCIKGGRTAWIAQVTPEQAAHKVAVLDHWCDELDRDPAEVERTLSLGPLLIRDDPAEAAAAVARVAETNPRLDREIKTGSADEIAAFCREYAALGFTHFIYHSPAPYDEETLERFASEVRPALT